MTKAVMQDPVEFTKTLVTIIAGNNAKAYPRMVDVLKQAKDEYDRPKKNTFTGYLYSWTRQPSEELDALIKFFEKPKPAHQRLEKLLDFFGTGNWGETSANREIFHYLVLEGLVDNDKMPIYDVEPPKHYDYPSHYLIKSVVPEIIKNLMEIVPQEIQSLKKEVPKQIQKELGEEIAARGIRKREKEAHEERLKEREREREALQAKVEARKKAEADAQAFLNKQIADSVALFSDAEKAKQYAKENPKVKAIHVSITPVETKSAPVAPIPEATGAKTKVNKFFGGVKLAAKPQAHWKLTWHDFTGGENSLVLESYEQLSLPLVMPANDSDELLKIKKLCSDQVKKFLFKTKLLTDFKEEELADKTSIYVLRQIEGKFSLFWYDSFSRPVPVDLSLDKHKSLARWLKEQESLPENQKGLALMKRPVLQTFLQHIRVAYAADKTKLAMVEAVLQKGSAALALLNTANQFSSADAINYPAKSFVLTQENKVWKLFYITDTNEAIEQNLKALPKAKGLFLQWNSRRIDDKRDNATPETMDQVERHQFAQLLANFTPNEPQVLNPEELSATLALLNKVNQFSASNAIDYPAKSFVLTQDNQVWKLFYISEVNEAIEQSIKKVLPDAIKLFSEWALKRSAQQRPIATPETLDKTEVYQLAQRLFSFKPSMAKPLQLKNFSDVSDYFQARSDKLAEEPKVKVFKTPKVTDSELAQEQPKKINLDLYASILTFRPEKGKIERVNPPVVIESSPETFTPS